MYDELKTKLEGPCYTIFTPFEETEEQNVDYASLEKYLKLLYKKGARRFYAMAYNSRYSQMTTAEIMQLNEFCARQLKQLDKNNVVIVGDPIHCSTRESLEFARHAKDSSADLISLIMREKYFFDDQILEHFDYIGRNSNFPLLVHEMPFLSGFDGTQMHWPASLIARLPEIDHIAALKEDAKVLDVAIAALKLEPQIRVIIAGGGKARFRELMKYGARAWLNGISIIDAKIAEVFWNACAEDDIETQNFIIDSLEKPFFGGVAKKYGWHRTNKALLQAAGMMSRTDRMPLRHLNDDEFVEVQQVYSEVSLAWEQFQKERKI
jgi:4-hydroxy-tetrahydrodipicolinate synthase